MLSSVSDTAKDLQKYIENIFEEEDINKIMLSSVSNDAKDLQKYIEDVSKDHDTHTFTSLLNVDMECIAMIEKMLKTMVDKGRTELKSDIKIPSKKNTLFKLNAYMKLEGEMEKMIDDMKLGFYQLNVDISLHRTLVSR